jgi:hypothetical protein
MNTTTEITQKHCFEAAGLGKAPYKIVSAYASDIPTSCDYCGTGIVNVYIIQSSCNIQFKAGCECVKKTGDEGLMQDIRRRQQEARAQTKMKKAIAIDAMVGEKFGVDINKANAAAEIKLQGLHKRIAEIIKPIQAEGETGTFWWSISSQMQDCRDLSPKQAACVAKKFGKKTVDEYTSLAAQVKAERAKAYELNKAADAYRWQLRKKK